MVTCDYRMLVDWDNSGEELSNGDFESDLTGWTEVIDAGITGTSAQSTAESVAKLGSLGSLKLQITGSTGAGDVIRYQDVDAAEGEVWWLEVYAYIEALSDCQVAILIQWLNSGMSVIDSDAVTIAATNSDFAFQQVEAVTAPANTVTARISLRIQATDAGASGTIYYDLVRAFKQTAGAEDVSADLQEVSWDWGADQASQTIGKFVSLNATATLKNYDDAYNSYAVSDVKPARRVRCFGTDASGTEQLWEGFLTRVVVRPELSGRKTAEFQIIGALALINQRTVEVEMQTSISPGDAMDDLLDDLGWPAADRFIADGLTTFTRWWASNQDFLSAAQEVEGSELGRLYELRNGRIAFGDRHERLDATHQTSQATFSDAGGASLAYSAIEQEDPLQVMVNVFETDVQLYTTDTLAVLWTLAEISAIAAPIEPGASRTYIARYPNQGSSQQGVGVSAWTTPVATTDYTFNTTAGGGGDDATGDMGLSVDKRAQRMLMTFTNNGSVDAYPTFMQARGTPTFAADPIPVLIEDETSKDAYYPRRYPFRPAFIPTIQGAEDLGRLIVATGKDPLPLPRITYLANRNATSLSAALRLNIGDRVTLVADNNTGMGITSRDFFIEWESHTVMSLYEKQVTLQLSDAEVFSDFWVLGYSELGINTRLAA